MEKKSLFEQIPRSTGEQPSPHTARRTMGIMDIYVSAFLLYRGLQPTVELRGNKAVFVFETLPGVYDLLDQFNSNASVDVADYATAVKTLRGKMLSAKEGINGHGKGGGHGYPRS